MNEPSPPAALVLLGSPREAMSLGPVLLEADTRPGELRVIPALVGSRASLTEAAALMGISAQYVLPLDPGQRLPHHERLARITAAIAPLVEELQPDMVLVAGEGWTPAAAALLSGYRGLFLAHVEAGLRFRRPPGGGIPEGRAPAPIVFHRRLLAAAAGLHLAPTAMNAANLVREGVDPDRVHITGTPLVAAAGHVRPALDPEGAARAVWAGSRRLVLAAVEGEEPTPELLVELCRALRAVAARVRDTLMVFQRPARPALERVAARFLSDAEGVAMVPPLGYRRRWSFLDRAYCAVTTGGPLEDEGPCFGTPVLVMSGTTDRPEAVELGSSALVGRDGRRLARALFTLLQDPRRREDMSAVPNPYGDRDAARRILQALLHSLGRASRPASFRASTP